MGRISFFTFGGVNASAASPVSQQSACAVPSSNVTDASTSKTPGLFAPRAAGRHTAQPDSAAGSLRFSASNDPFTLTCMTEPASHPHTGQHQRTVNMATETTRARTSNVRLLMTKLSASLRDSSSNKERMVLRGVGILAKDGRYSDVAPHRS